jgi:hypothetical protein
MVYNENALIHDRGCFTRETLTKRLDELGFNNLARMELFLWDLEIFLQIQSILKDKVVLKGGAASQFYIPVEHQRTSVDIDMICVADIKEVENTLGLIEKRFNGEETFFKFRLHKPKTSKTDLPLLAYYLDVPSVCGENEVFGGSTGIQEIKIEFFMLKESLAIHNISSPVLFALTTDNTYQIMPLNALIGDKLTTLGVNTIGIPPERADEYIKQVYDVDSLVTFNWHEVDFDDIKEHFIYRARLEAVQRGISFNKDTILADMIGQMEILSSIDMERSDELRKLINDFQSLYLRRSITKPMAEWAITGARLGFLLRCLDEGTEGKKQLEIIQTIENKLKFDWMQGEERGKAIRRFNDAFTHEFEKYSRWPAKVLKGKHPVRILWAIVSPVNLKEVSYWVNDFLKINSTQIK